MQSDMYDVWAQEALDNAELAALRLFGHRTVGTGHLIYGVLDRGFLDIKMMETDFFANVTVAKRVISTMTAPLPQGIGKDFRYTDGYNEALEVAKEQSVHSPIGQEGRIFCEHILAGVLIVNDAQTQQVMERLGLADKRQHFLDKLVRKQLS